MKNKINWKRTLESFIFAIYGGFVGAVIGLYALELHTGKQALFLIFIYGIPVFLLVWLLNFTKNNEKEKN